jgi:ferric enterobactin receptor
MNRRIRALLAATALVVAVPLAGQNPQAPPAGPRPGMGAPGQPGGTIAGRVVDGGGAPLRAAQVAVWSAADSTLVTGATVRPDGTFRIEGLRPGRYFLRVSALGYASAATAVVAVTPAAPVADVGSVRMAQGALLLEGVTVTAEAAPAQMEIDRNTYSVRDMPAAAGGNATDVLRNVPSVEVDQDGRVSLRGNQNVAVQINGRPSPMRGEQLGNFLQQLPANMLERVEVVPNPSARYEPEGMAGIINIVLRENADLGLSGGIMTGLGNAGRANASGNLGYQSGPWTLFGSYGFRMDERRNRGFSFLERYAEPGGAAIFSLDQTARGTFDMLSNLFNGSADYRLNARDVLSTTVMASRGSFDNATDNRYLETGGPLGSRRYLGETRVDASDLTLDGVLAFRRTIRPRQNEWAVEVRYNRNDNENVTRFEESALTESGEVGASTRLESTRTDALSTTAHVQLDVTRPLGGTRLETGYKGTLRQLDNQQGFESFDDGSGSWVPNPARSQAFEYDERVHAGYAVLHRGFGAVEAQAGLRVERTDREFRLAATDEVYPKSYWSFFPSGLASLALDDRRQVRLSYSRRIRRPDTRLLNPFPFNEDQRNRFVGNPGLDPEYTNAFELTYQHALPTGSVQVTPFYRRTENAIRRFTELRGDTAITTFRNLDVNESYGADLNVSYRSGRLSGFTGASVFRTVTDAGAEGPTLNADALGWSTRVNANLRITPKLEAQGFVMYRAPMVVEQGRTGARTFSSVSLRQRVLNDRGSISLRLQDPLNRMGFYMRTEQPLYFQENERRFGGRSVYLAFSYGFGQQPRLRQQRNGQQQEPTEPMQVPGSIDTP